MNRDYATQLLFVLLGLLAVAGCNRAADAPAEGPGRTRSEVERGPVKLSVEIEPARPTLSDVPTMTLSIDYRQGVTIEQPEFAEAIGDFRIVDLCLLEPQIRDDREIVEQVFTLEPTRTGQLPIWPISINFTDNSPDGDGKRHTIETKQLSVDVGSVVESQVNSLDELRAETPPIALRGAISLYLPVIAAVILLIAAGGMIWLWRSRRERAAEALLLSPREKAQLALQKLWNSGLAGRDAKLYYVELTGIVRRYIEVTTAVRAPEQTTEEFLYEISRNDTFAPDERRRLKNFLEAADLVKFAAHRPRPEDVEASYERAMEFVGSEHSNAVFDEQPQETPA